MVIAKDNMRLPVTMPKELYKDLQELADKENRSVSNYIVSTLKQKVEQQKSPK